MRAAASDFIQPHHGPQVFHAADARRSMAVRRGRGDDLNHLQRRQTRDQVRHSAHA